jgi:hypothetical protein
MSFWKKLLGRRQEETTERAEADRVETPSERRITDEGVDGLKADQTSEERIGGVDVERLVDDEFKP